MEKVRYEIDPFNRLVIIEKPSSLPRHRRVLDGVFRTDGTGSLSYHLKTPIPNNIGPKQIRLRGNWSLTKNHDLQFTLEANKDAQRANQLIMSGKLIDLRGDSILFSMSTKNREGLRKTYALEISGSWAADEHNRLTFSVKKESGESDILTFDAAWSVNKDNEIVYRYEKRYLSRKTAVLSELTIRGHWHILNKGAITYLLDSASNSRFDFRTGIGICDSDSIIFELGMGLGRGLKPRRTKVILYGRWKIAKDTGILFEIQRSGGKTYSIVFGAWAKLSKDNTVNLKLTGPAGGEDLGLRLDLEHDIFKSSGSAFLRLLKSKEESAVLIGAGFPW